MKKHVYFLFLIFIYIISCKNYLRIESDLKETNNETITIKCEEITKEDEDPNLDSTIIRTCYFKNYKTIATGLPSYVGKYYWEYELYKKENEVFNKIINTLFFNSNFKELEQLINDKIKKEYETNLKNPELSQCMSWIKLRYYKLNEMGITFNENNTIDFHIYFGIGSACDNVGSTIQSFKISEISRYLN